MQAMHSSLRILESPPQIFVIGLSLSAPMRGRSLSKWRGMDQVSSTLGVCPILSRRASRASI